MKKIWEYKKLLIPDHVMNREEEMLNCEGELRWELFQIITIENYNHYYFKRVRE